MRACAIMEKTQKSGEGVKTSARLAEEAAERKERMERLESNYIITVQSYGRKYSHFSDNIYFSEWTQKNVVF